MAKATVRVLLFGRLRQEHGWHERLMRLPQPATVARLQQELGICCPGLCWAVNQDFATPEHRLQPDDEVAFLPPITGGRSPGWGTSECVRNHVPARPSLRVPTRLPGCP